MKLKFDVYQQYPHDAIDAMIGVFEEQPLNKGDF